jgi:hypothetical protein
MALRVTLAILCVGAVTFLLRVLTALVKESVSWPPTAVTVHFAKFNPSRRQGELIEMSPESRRRKVSAIGERMAL